MLTPSQRKEVEKYLGTALYSKEICFYMLSIEKNLPYIESTVKNLARVYGFALFETVDMAENVNNKISFTRVSRIRVLTSEKMFNDKLNDLFYLVHAIIHLFDYQALDVAIDNELFNVKR